MRATFPTEADEQPVLGAAPPTVLTRWTLVTLLNKRSGPTDLGIEAGAEAVDEGHRAEPAPTAAWIRLLSPTCSPV